MSCFRTPPDVCINIAQVWAQAMLNLDAPGV